MNMHVRDGIAEHTRYSGAIFARPYRLELSADAPHLEVGGLIGSNCGAITARLNT